MNHSIYGCPCCSGVLGEIFAANKIVAAIKHQARNQTGFSASGSGVSRRTFVSTIAVVAGISSFVPKITFAQDAVTTVFRGGTILTVDAAFSQAEAIAIRDQRIIAVGTEADVLAAAGEGAIVVDLAGRTMLPGFVEPHTHVVTGSVIANIMDYVGMTRFATTAQVLEYLTDKASKTPVGEWIACRNFDPAVQTGPAALTFAELDAVSTDHPVFLMNASGHLAYANRKAFEAAGVAMDVANPPGGEFVRDQAGNLTGTMKNNVSYIQVLNAYPALANADPVESLIALTEKWSALGLTTVSELSLGALTQSPADTAILDAVASSGRLKARIRAYPFYTVGAKAWDGAGVVPGDDAMVRIAGYKLVADGSNQGFTGLQREPYLNSESRGLAYLSPEELTAQSLDRAQKGWHLSIHGNGDAGIDNILDAADAMRAAGVDMDKLRLRIEHCSILHDEQIARMADLKISPSFLIGHMHFWGIAFRDEVFGPEKTALLGRLNSVEKAGIGYSVHSDFMVTDPNPLHMIEMAVTRKTWKEPDTVLTPDERVTVESAIRAITSEAAWQLYSDHEVGSLEVGKFADFVILEADPRAVDPSAIKDIGVLETWLNGEQVYAA